MLERLTCLQGHAWEAPAATESPRCPECGLPPEPAFAEPEETPAPPPPPIHDEDGRPVVVGYETLADRGRTPAGVRLYQARQLAAGREVLLEVVLAREDAGQRAWNSLCGEAGGHGRLSHPHVVQLYEAGERDRQLFYNAMEFVDGPTLAEAVGGEPVPVAQAVAVVELLARAVAYAHDRRQIHRHLEPNAVLLQRVPAPKGGPAKENPGGGVCRLGDGFYIPRLRGFGLARRPVEGDILDIDLYDQPGYLSPEQSWGKGRELGPHTDVYGLGGILYFLLTGRPPFRGPTQDDIIDAIQTAALIKPSEIRRTPPSLEYVCRVALTRRASRRYRDATEMADDLRRVALHQPPAGSKLGAWRRLDLFCRRRPATVMGLALLAWIVLGTIGTAVAITMTAGGREGDAKPRGKDANASLAESNRLRIRLREMTAWQQINDYQGRIRSAARVAANDKREARSALDECPAAARDFEWHYLDRLLSGDEKITLPDSENATAFAFSGRDFRRAAVAESLPGEKISTIRVLDVATSEQRFALTVPESPVRGVAYLENGQLAVLAGTTPGRLFLYDGRRLAGQGETAASPSFIGTAAPWNRLLVLGESGELAYHDPTNARPFGKPRSILPPGFEKSPRMRLALRPNGLGAALSDGSREGVYLWSEDAPHAPFEEFDGTVECMASDAAGVLAVATTENRIFFACPDGVSVAPYRPKKADVKQMAFSVEGKRLAVAYADGTLAVLGFAPPRPDELQLDGKEDAGRWVELLTVPVSGVRGLAFGPDGKTLAASGPKGVVVLGTWK